MNCRGPLRELPHSLSGLLPDLCDPFGKRAFEVARGSGFLNAGARGEAQRVEHLAEHVNLSLLGGGIADAHRASTVVAGQPARLPLLRLPPAIHAVHDLQLLRAASDGAQHPFPPGVRLLMIAGIQQRGEGEGRVAQPAETIIPVRRSARHLRQRGGRRRDHAAGSMMRERLERDERAHHRVPPRCRLAEPGGPVLPPARRFAQCRVGVRRRRWWCCGFAVAEREGDAVPFGESEIGAAALLRHMQRNPRAEHDQVRADRSGEAVSRLVMHPGCDASVIESCREIEAHRHRPAQADENAHQRRAGVARRHEVDQPRRTLPGLEIGLQHQRVRDVAARDARRGCRGCDPPAPVLVGAEQGRKTRIAVEARPAQPVDGAVACHQRGTRTVADQRIVLDRPAHRAVSSEASAAKLSRARARCGHFGAPTG